MLIKLNSNSTRNYFRIKQYFKYYYVLSNYSLCKITSKFELRIIPCLLVSFLVPTPFLFCTKPSTGYGCERHQNFGPGLKNLFGIFLIFLSMIFASLIHSCTYLFVIRNEFVLIFLWNHFNDCQ